MVAIRVRDLRGDDYLSSFPLFVLVWIVGSIAM